MSRRCRCLVSSLVLGVALFHYAACVSRTLPAQRFQESEGLAAPVSSVSLPDPENYRFAIVGDLHLEGGGTNRFRQILQQASALGDAFIFLLGDIADKGRREDFLAYQTAIEELGWKGRAFPVIGNHDVFADGWQAYREVNGPSHYTLTLGNARFIVLDTADGAVGEAEGAWLESTLPQPGPRHTFLLSHYLPLIPGIRTYLKLADEVQASRLMKLAASNGITGWLGAHYHSFVLGKIEGVDYVVAGGGGGRRMGPVEKYFFVDVGVNGPQVSYQLHPVE